MFGFGKKGDKKKKENIEANSPNEDDYYSSNESGRPQDGRIYEKVKDNDEADYSNWRPGRPPDDMTKASDGANKKGIYPDIEENQNDQSVVNIQELWDGLNDRQKSVFYLKNKVPTAPPLS